MHSHLLPAVIGFYFGGTEVKAQKDTKGLNISSEICLQ